MDILPPELVEQIASLTLYWARARLARACRSFSWLAPPRPGSARPEGWPACSKQEAPRNVLTIRSANWRVAEFQIQAEVDGRLIACGLKGRARDLVCYSGGKARALPSFRKKGKSDALLAVVATPLSVIVATRKGALTFYDRARLAREGSFDLARVCDPDMAVTGIAASGGCLQIEYEQGAERIIATRSWWSEVKRCTLYWRLE